MQIPQRTFPKLAALLTAWALMVVALPWGEPAAAQALTNPRRIADGPQGLVLVTDRGSGSVVALRKDDLEQAWSFALPDEGAPFGLATWNRLIFVGNTETHHVEVYRVQGAGKAGPTLRFEYNLGLGPPEEPGPFENPIAVAFDGRQKLVFVLDGRRKVVDIFDRKGGLVGSFVPRDGAGEVMSPVALAIDETRQEVLVSDYGDPSGFFRGREPARILIYGYSGDLRFQIDGDGGTHPATQFARVQGLAASADGTIFVADPLGSRVLVLDRVSGELLAEIGEEGSQPGELMLPLDVLLDERTGDLFVTNNQGARKVEAFRGRGRLP